MEKLPVRMVRETLTNLPVHPVPPPYSLRTWQPGDDAVWTDIQNRADYLDPIDHGKYYAASFGGDYAALADRMFFLLDGDGAAIGTTTAWFGPRADGRDWGRIHWVAIVPEYQGRGLSKPMVTAALRRLARSHDRAWLDTQSPRVTAIRIYLDLGFAPEIESDDDRRAWDLVRQELGARS